MVEKIENLPRIHIRHKGVYNLTDIYQIIRTWLFERRYDFNEKKYKDKVASHKGNETELDMEATREITDFVKFKINLETKFYDVKEFPMVIKGEKQMVNNGKFEIWISGEITFDYQGKYKTDFEKKLLRFMLKFFNNYYGSKYVDKLQYEIYDLQTKIKEYMEMEAQHNAY